MLLIYKILDYFSYLLEMKTQSIHSRCGKCAKFQIFGTFATPNTKMELYEMCQISKIIQHGYSIDANLQQYGQMLQNFYCFIFPFLSPLSSFFLFSSLSLFGSLSLLLVLVPSLFDQFGMLTGNDDGVAPTTTVGSAPLDQPRSISLISP